MLNVSLLYPCNNLKRTAVSLDGMWQFAFDAEEQGDAACWKDALPNSIQMPAPASFSDFFTTAEERDYCGDFWYAKHFFVSPLLAEQCIELRFGSIAHRATVYCNGIEICFHEGGFLPVVADITNAVRFGEDNLVVIKANNELNETSLPCGATMTLKNGRKLAKPYFDFYHYAGIQRSVWLVSKPRESVVDYTVSYELEDKTAIVHYLIETNGKNRVRVFIKDGEGSTVAQAEGKSGALRIEDVHLWNVRKAYLYQIIIQIVSDKQIIDEYTDRIGVRTVEIQGNKILINQQPVYLKGYGKHEDFELIGRGFNWSVLKRDFECMKWSNANCFRTSHYPYAEEWYRFADEEGFLIIDEVPAVGMMRSTRNFVDAGKEQYTYFFEAPTVPELKANHLQVTEEMIIRDKNHPSVIAWSLFNEPETITDYSYAYFRDIFQAARELDMQKRPLTGAFEKNSKPELCKCYPLCDFICLNRYYGWYIKGGAEITDAKLAFIEEMEKWREKDLNIPFVFTEFGTDTLSSEHKLPSVMWTQEYQNEYLQLCFDVFDQYDFVQGELVWNFADFQTTEGIMRVNGNKKGVFTRTRQPKNAAFFLKERWEKKDLQ